MSSENPIGKSSIRQRFLDELSAYAGISLYLWICFGALLLYKKAILSAEHMQFQAFGIAAVKALILGKFILISKAVKIGDRRTPDVLLLRIVWKSLGILLSLMVLTAIEELLVGLGHGRALSEITAEFMNRSLLQNLAPSIVMLIVLIPLILFEEVDRYLGKGSLKRMLLDRSDHE